MVRHRLSPSPKPSRLRAALAAALAACTLGVALPAHADPGSDRVQAAAQDSEKKITATASDVLALARAQIGITENAQGGGTKFQHWYAGSRRALETVARDGGHPSAYLNAPWCAMFVSWVGEQLGAGSQVGSDAYTVTHAQWFRDNNRWGTEPRPGAVVFFAWNGSNSIGAIQHVGFVVKDNNNGTITTIEGNTGRGKVEERIRPKWQVVGYGYPEYAA